MFIPEHGTYMNFQVDQLMFFLLRDEVLKYFGFLIWNDVCATYTKNTFFRHLMRKY